ncbi:thiamine biosynthesis protein [Salinarchaeum sp. Harcht-Bsk1]|uniref:tRNA sulfurtransferase n=1 Tax=Salinarchaeum sp. Harcht-Bsk1 TaxID=1333523 RepID=UPI00034246CF|nr:THUMP domain-containing protein [Salinarchaeum sp. Harcht-Bsk1]AGN01840.1 thiamine biosynthesis protein [Salinarchaeum sp. Harcht-Bsk1]
MHPPGASTVLLRYGDLTTKSHAVGGRMRDRLGGHLEALLDARDLDATIDVGHARTILDTEPAEVEAVARTAADVFGAVSASPALAVEPTKLAIESALREAAAAHYDGGTFAVEARRAHDGHPFTSEDVGRFGGDAVGEGAPEGVEPRVDLDDPDLTFEVEVRESVAYVSLDRIEGPGGLPYGTQAPLVALISGGIDSPVAAYEVMRRGSPIVPVYLDLGDYGGADHEARAVETVRKLAWHAPQDDWELYRVPAGESVAAIADALDRGRMLAFRRYTVAVAEAIAREHDAAGIVTGEAIGQKSSQTVRNLAITDAATELPVHRPLLSWDKDRISNQARALDTFAESTIPAGCNRFAPDNAETGGSLGRIRETEPTDLFERAKTDAADADAIRIDPAAPADWDR